MEVDEQRQRPIYIHIDSSITEPVNQANVNFTTFHMPLNAPLVIDRDIDYRVTLIYAYTRRQGGNSYQRAAPCRLLIKGLGAGNCGRVLRHRLASGDGEFTCVLPASRLEGSCSVRMLPPTPGIYHHLEVQVQEMQGDLIEMKHILMTIEILPRNSFNY
jgi:hypothetical protein